MAVISAMSQATADPAAAEIRQQGDVLVVVLAGTWKLGQAVEPKETL